MAEPCEPCSDNEINKIKDHTLERLMLFPTEYAIYGETDMHAAPNELAKAAPWALSCVGMIS
jgi:hypothetical protein